MKKIKGLFAIGLLLTILLSTSSVLAVTGSIGNARMILYPEVNGLTTTTIEKTILVRNVNEEHLKVTLELDAEGKNFLEIIDNEFILKPNEEKKANFLVKVKKEGRYEGRINVFFSPIEEGPGVVLSSTIIVSAKKDQTYQDIEEKQDQEEQESLITGGVIGNDEKNQRSLFILILSTFILIVVLAFLIYLMNNKKIKSSSRKKK
ncbi:MAG: hypothetical protein ABIA78_01390 [archaeon]